MKNFYLLIILLVSGFGFAQNARIGEYEVKTVLNIKGGSGSYSSSCRNDVKVDLIYNDGTITVINENIGGIPSDRYTLYEKTINVLATRKPVKVQVYSSRNWKRKVGGCGGKGSFNGDKRESTQFFSCLNNYTDIVRWWDDKLSITNNPILTIINPKDDSFPTDSNITIVSHTGFLPSEYNWQYSLNPDPGKDLSSRSWTDLPQYNTQSSISTNAKAILGANAANFHGSKIYFRQKACNIVSDPAMYIIRQSAPFIVSKNEKETTCFNSEDGKLVLKFSRPLISAEQLNYSIIDYDEEKQIWKEVMCSTQDNGGIIVDASNSFQIPCDFAKGRYKLYFIGSINGINTNPSTNFDNPFFFEIKSPAPVDFSITSKTNILCYGVDDGAIEITATGGAENGIYQYSTNYDATWKSFTNGNKHTIINLQKGDCIIKVRKIKTVSDTIGCIAKQSGTEDDKTLTENISKPENAVAMSYTLIQNPTFYGAANGILVAAISGGTINDDKSYSFEWKNSIGVVMPATGQYNSADKTYNITLENAPEGEYKLTVKDKNYNNAVNKTGCSIIESSQILTQPDKIKITLQEIQPISCNTENGESDINKFSDGILKATVNGGIPFTGTANNGLAYSFIWSIYNTTTSLWEELPEYKTATAENLSKGNYSLNIIDANGIVQGTYSTTDLVTAIPTTKEIVEPTKLELSFDSGNVSCHAGNNGWAQANVTGGYSPYIYTWYNTGEGIIDLNKISHLTAGTYTVEVIDAKGCFTKGSIVISEPEFPVAIEYIDIFTPTFFGATNGRIVAEITGGTPNDNKSYNYEWKNSSGVLQTTTAVFENGIYTITLNNVPADKYFLTITDKNYNEATNQTVNCSILESEVKLTEPDPLVVTFEIIRTISCNTGNEFGNDTDTTPQDGQRDESQDGILKAHVTGGIQLASSVNNGLPYFFYWKKQQADGSWLALSDIKGETASNLSHGNYALNIKDRNGIMLGTYINNVLTQEIDVTQLMQEPPKLAVTITHGDVFCNGGNDGWATANVVGGTPPYDYRWSNEVDIDKNTFLKAGKYWVFITDAKGCTTQESVTILQPLTPLAIKYTEILDPSFYKATNGKIVAEVTGGTISSDNSYWFEWKNSKGITQTTTTTSFNNGVYTISLNGLPEETYSLTVRDANYNAATNKISCTVANSITALDDPDPLEVTFEVVRTISCNVSNEFGNETDTNPQDNQRDESQDGILVAHVKGGIQLKADKNNALPYFYTWKKQQKDGSWIIWNDQDETAENVSDGTYALNIEDANGIKLGTYVNNLLVKEIDVTQYMPEPAKLNLTFTKANASCNNGDDGWAEAHVSGGTPPYTYEWTNGETTSRIENITTNNYFVIATDAKGCVVQGSIFVGDPKGIFTTETVKNPTCYSGNDGSIELNVIGGNLPYSFLWNTGATTKDLNNLEAGNYEVTISCTDCCVYKKKFVLKDPNPIVVDLGKDRTLCNDQVLNLDATISDDKAQYSWSSTNGFTSNQAKVSLTKAGTYTVKVTSGLGCIGEDEIVIKTSKAVISSEFLLSSQAYLDEEVILVNTSSPFGESTNWMIPKGVKIVEQKEKYITLKFDATGVYSIGLQQTQGDCYATYSKNITVEQRSTLPSMDAKSQFIVDFVVTPNPSDGNFKAFVTLENNTPINLRLFSSTGQNTMIQKKESGKKKYEIVFDNSLVAGMYVLVLETGQQTLVKKIIIY